MNVLSEEKLATCDPRLYFIIEAADKIMPLVVICGERTEAEQAENIKKGVSWTMNSLHLRRPSLAVDVAPKPVDWNNLDAFRRLKDVIFKAAEDAGVELVWGGDWKQRDLGHYQIKQ